jgi:predicted nucleotidyltransferase/predicted transcriptional regulator
MLQEKLLISLYGWGPLTSKEMASVTKSDLQTVRTLIQKLEKKRLITKTNKKLKTEKGRPEFLYILTSTSKDIIIKFLIKDFLEKMNYKVEYEKNLHKNTRIDVFGKKENEIIGVEIKLKQLQWSFLRYKKYLNKLYLALPKHSVNSKILTKCKNEGIGVLQLDNNIKEVLKPLRFEPLEKITKNLVTKRDNMKLESKIVDLLAKNMERGFTINGIAKNLEEFYSFVHRTVNKLSKDGVVIKTKVGKSYLCSLNLENEKTATLIQLSEIEKRESLYTVNKELKLILEDFIRTLESQHKNIIAIILFGSYAKGTATKESDIDILLISNEKIEIEKVAKEIYAKYGKEIIPILMTQNDFKKQKDKAVITEMIKNHYVLHGVENFVNLVFRK